MFDVNISWYWKLLQFTQTSKLQEECECELEAQFIWHWWMRTWKFDQAGKFPIMKRKIPCYVAVIKYFPDLLGKNYQISVEITVIDLLLFYVLTCESSLAPICPLLSASKRLNIKSTSCFLTIMLSLWAPWMLDPVYLLSCRSRILVFSRR